MQSYPLFILTYLFLLYIFLLINSYISLLISFKYLKIPNDDSLIKKIQKILENYFIEPYEKCLKIITGFFYKILSLKRIVFVYWAAYDYVNYSKYVDYSRYTADEIKEKKNIYIFFYFIFNVIPRVVVLSTFLIEVCYFQHIHYAFQVLFLLILPLLLRFYWYQKKFVAESMLEETYDSTTSQLVKNMADNKEELFIFVKEFNLSASSTASFLRYVKMVYVFINKISLEEMVEDDAIIVIILNLLYNIALWKFATNKIKLIFTILCSIVYLFLFFFYIAYGVGIFVY